MPTKSKGKPARGSGRKKAVRRSSARVTARETSRERQRPKPPLPPQSQPAPGLEREMTPRHPAYGFFASNGDSSFITGEVLTLLGGETTAA